MPDGRTPWPHTGAILCGGKSRRMGRPKAEIVLPDGRRMAECVYDALSVVCRQVVLVGGNVETLSGLSDLPPIADRISNVGPLGGVEALLASGLDTEYLIAPCDVFLAVPELFLLLVEPEVAAPAVLVAEGSQRVEPLVARYGTAAHPIVRDMIEQGRLSMRELARRCDARRIPVPQSLDFALQNANTPSDLCSMTARGA